MFLQHTALHVFLQVYAFNSANSGNKASQRKKDMRDMEKERNSASLGMSRFGIGEFSCPPAPLLALFSSTV